MPDPINIQEEIARLRREMNLFDEPIREVNPQFFQDRIIIADPIVPNDVWQAIDMAVPDNQRGMRVPPNLLVRAQPRPAEPRLVPVADQDELDFDTAHRKYRETFVGYKAGDKVYPAMVVEVHNLHPIQFELTIYTPKHMYLRMVYTDCILDWPDLGAFNYRKSAVYVSRRIRRQYRKGLTPDQTVVLPVNAVFDRMLNVRTYQFDIDLLREVYSPTYMNLDAAEACLLKGERGAVAVNNKYSLSLKQGIPNPIILNGVTAIGELSDSKPKLWKGREMFIDELNQLRA